MVVGLVVINTICFLFFEIQTTFIKSNQYHLFECDFEVYFGEKKYISKSIETSVSKCKQKLVNKSKCIWSKSLIKCIKFL
jgi:hypothetical protein